MSAELRDAPSLRRCRRVTRCVNGVRLGLSDYETLRAPTLDELPSDSDREAMMGVFRTGQRFVDAHGRCLYGHTDVSHANVTEVVRFFEMPSSAGRCGRCTGALLPEEFSCACVGPNKVANALDVEWHHEWHHGVIGGATVAAIALVAAACVWHAHRASAMVLGCLGLTVLGGGWLVHRGLALRASVARAWWAGAAMEGMLEGGTFVPPEGWYWKGCGAQGWWGDG